MLDEIVRALLVKLRLNSGVDVGSRRRINLIEGTNIDITIADDSDDDELDVQIAAAAHAPAAHALGGAQHSAATLAELNAKVSDATLDANTGTRDPNAHASEHTDGTDDIQDATASVKGVATAAQITKLDGIATSADVTGSNAPMVHEASHQGAGGDILYVPRTYVWFIAGTIATGTEQGATFRIKRATVVEDVEMHIKTAPTGAALIVDINDGGTTIFSTEPEIDISGTTEDDNHVISDAALAATTELTMDVVQVGSTEAGVDLTVLLHCYEAVI